MARISVAPGTTDENRVERELGPSFQNKTSEPVTHSVPLQKDWINTVRVADSAVFSGIRGAALIPYIEGALTEGGGWSFTAGHTDESYSFSLPPKSEAVTSIEWWPVTSKGVIVTETSDPDIEFTVVGTYRVRVLVQIKNLA